MFITFQSIVAVVGVGWFVYGLYRQELRYVIEGLVLIAFTVLATMLWY
jgi:hypothetical protein